MTEYLIQTETLKATADAFRANLPSTTRYEINPEVTENQTQFLQGAVTIHYYEYVDYNSGYDEAIPEGRRPDEFVEFNYVPNNEGIIVPVIYKANTTVTDPQDEYYGPDYNDSFFYEGNAVVDGQTYDKWRKIENEVSPLFGWDTSSKQYVYTNVIVRSVTVPNSEEFDPVDFPSKVYEVYETGYNKGYADSDGAPILYGTYLLKDFDERPTEGVESREFTETDGVYGYFFDGYNYYQKLIGLVDLDMCFDIYSNTNATTTSDAIKLIGTKWYWFSDDAYGELTDDRFRVLDFTKPITVSKPFYDLFMSLIKLKVNFTPYDIGYSEGYEAQPTPTISVNSSGLVTATAGEKSATKQLTTQGAKTITPRQDAQTAVYTGRYTTGEIVVAGDVNLYSGNIRAGRSIFGVTGTFDNYELGRRHCVPEYVQSINERTLSATDYDGAKIGGYALSCFNGALVEPGSLSESLSYAYTDFIDYSVSDSENFEITITNKHHTLPVYVYIQVSYRANGGDVSEIYRKAIRVLPEGEASYEFQNEYGYSDFEWAYSIRGLCFTSYN